MADPDRDGLVARLRRMSAATFTPIGDTNLQGNVTCDEAADRISADGERLATLRALVDKQAADPSLWFQHRYITEDILQRALRTLHAAIEGVSPEAAALAALTETSEEGYVVTGDGSGPNQAEADRMPGDENAE